MNVRKVLSLALILFLTFTLAVPAFASVDLSDPQYVVDDANVLSAETEQKILDTNRMLWDECSGAGPFTLKRYFRSGTLYVTLSSSVIRNQLSFQKEALIEKMNACLSGDSLFTDDNRTAGFVKDLVLR